MYNWEFETNEKKKAAPKVVPSKEAQDDPSVTSGSNDDSSIEFDLNTIYFYSGVTQQDNFVLNKYLAKLDRDLPIVQQKYKLRTKIPIHFKINS